LGVPDLITTSGLDAREGEALWQYAMGEIFVPVTIDRVTDHLVGGAIRSHSVGRLMVAEVTSTAQHIRRAESHISRADKAYFQVAVVAGGAGRVTQDDRQAELHAGDCVVYETVRPFEWHFDAEWDVWVFSFPVGSVQLDEGKRRSLTARQLDGRAGVTGVVSRFLLDLANNIEHLSHEQSERVVAQASDLVVTLLSGSLNGDDAIRGCVQRSLMLRIKDYIEQRLSDPALRPSDIASAVNISTRYLHKLFEEEHRTVSLYIRERRLEQARRALLDSRLEDRSISTIAYGCGFGDLSGFNRAFKDAFAVTPKEIRSASAAQQSHWGLKPLSAAETIG
jgi:AraC-like DNA-binding protein